MKNFFEALVATAIIVVGIISTLTLVLIMNPFFWLAVIALILVIKL